MAKMIPDAVKDVALANIADNGNRMDICSAEPATYAEATSTYTLGNGSLTTGAGSGDYTISNGDVSGRKLHMAEQSFNGTANGTGTHIVITDTVAEAIKAITTCDAYSVLSGVGLIVEEYDVWEIKDPT